MTSPSRSDSAVALKAKAEMCAIVAGRATFDLAGQVVPVESYEQSYARLGLHARWGHQQDAQF